MGNSAVRLRGFYSGRSGDTRGRRVFANPYVRGFAKYTRGAPLGAAGGVVRDRLNDAGDGRGEDTVAQLPQYCVLWPLYAPYIILVPGIVIVGAVSFGRR